MRAIERARIRAAFILNIAARRFTVFLPLVAILGCAVPWQTYRVSPPVMGIVELDSDRREAVELVLSVKHRENPTLFEVQRTRLTQDGRFYFEPVALEIAGREFSKFYRAILRYREGERDEIVWRAEFSRKDLVGRIQLECALDRSPRVSQPCLVRDPLAHPWLVREGERSFRRLCARCHGEAGRGSTVAGDEAPDLSRIAARRGGRFDRMEIAERIEGSTTPAEHGPRTMPAWGERLSAEYWRYSNADQLTGATIDPIVAYLENLQGSDRIE